MSQRFSDAELACEWWHAVWEAKCLQADDYSSAPALLEAETIYRFATLPHAHEELGAYVFQCKECDMRLQTDNQHQCEIFARNHQYLAHDYYKGKP